MGGKHLWLGCKAGVQVLLLMCCCGRIAVAAVVAVGLVVELVRVLDPEPPRRS